MHSSGKILFGVVLLFLFIFISVGLGFLSKQIFNGNTIPPAIIQCPNIDTSQFYTVVIPDGKGGSQNILTYAVKSGGLMANVNCNNSYVDKIVLDLNESQINVVKGSIAFLWIIFLISMGGGILGIIKL